MLEWIMQPQCLKFISKFTAFCNTVCKVNLLKTLCKCSIPLKLWAKNFLHGGGFIEVVQGQAKARSVNLALVNKITGW